MQNSEKEPLTRVQVWLVLLLLPLLLLPLLLLLLLFPPDVVAAAAGRFLTLFRAILTALTNMKELTRMTKTTGPAKAQIRPLSVANQQLEKTRNRCKKP